MQDPARRSRTSLLDLPLPSILTVNTELLFWVAIILFAVITRFWDLGSRSYNHDESLHTVYSWYLYEGRGYKHDPMMHGPFQFHANALIFFLFGDSDYTGRILPAIFGVAAVVLPALLRPWLGRAGALLAASFIAISPDILYYSRFARNDIYHAVWSLLAILSLFKFVATRQKRYFIVGAMAISFMWATKEVVYIFGFSGVTFLLLALASESLFKRNYGLTSAIRSLDWQTVTTALAAALSIFVILYTTFFTNADGLRTGVTGALEYWLAQQEVARGGQPWYYYLLIVPLYDFMPLLAALMGIGYYAIRRNAASASVGGAVLVLIATAYALWGRPPSTSDSPIVSTVPIVLVGVAFTSFALAVFSAARSRWPLVGISGAAGLGFILAALFWTDALLPGPTESQWLLIVLLAWAVGSLTLAALRGRGDNPLFTAFLIHWLLTSFAIYSWAGEKMPWLALHMSLPAIMLGAKFVNDLWGRVQWSTVPQRGGLWLALLLPLISYTLLRVLTISPFQGISIQKIDATLQWLASVVIGGALIYAAYRLTRRLAWGEVGQVAFATLLAVLAAFTLRAAFTGAYEHGDVAVEMLIYAQGTPDVPAVVREIESLSQKLTGGKELQIVVESSETWPFAWYLRDYKNVAYPGSLEGPPQAPVVIAAAENEAAYKAWMANYVGVRRKLIWWFAEDYKGMNWERIFDTLGDAELRQSLLDFLFYRRFQVPLGQWPLRKEFTFYVRKDITHLVWTPTQLPPAEVEKADKELQEKQINVAAKVIVGQAGKAQGQFTTPKGLAVGGDGSIYVVDAGNHRVQKFDASGRFVLTLGTQGNGEGQFQEPWGIAVAPDGSFYVADTWNHRILKFDGSGRLLMAWGQFGDTGGQAAADRPNLFYGPRALAVDGQGNVWIVDTGNKRIVKHDADGRALSVVGGAGTALGQFSEPVGIAIGARSGEIFVADTWNHRVQRFGRDLAPLAQWPVAGWETTSVFNKPYIALDADENVFVTDPENHRVLKYSNTGTLLAILGKPGADNSSFNMPTGITIDSQGSLYVTDSFNNRLMKFDPIGK